MRLRSGFAAPICSALLAATFALAATVCLAQNPMVENDPEPPRNQTQQSPPQPNQPQQNQKQASVKQPGQISQPQGSPGQPSQSPSTPSQAQRPPAADQSQSSGQNPVQSNESSSKNAESEENSDQPARSQPAAKQPAPDQNSSGQNSNESSSRESMPKPAPQKQIAPAEVNQIPIRLDTSETIFAVLAALNSCGYDQDLAISDPIRAQVRAEVQRNLAESEEARSAQEAVCDFYVHHVASNNPNRNLSQYISLALCLDGPPHFMPRTREEDLPPDAGMISEFGTYLERFYAATGLHGIWERHRADYGAAMRRYHAPLAKMVLDTEVYLKEMSSQYLGRTFTVYLDFMGSPDETDARNYGTEYYVVVFPAPTKNGSSLEASLKLDQIRHTFLHYELDPLADKHFTSIKQLEPLLQSVKRAPLEPSFKDDISLLVTECLVRAIEIRMTGSKTEEAMRQQAVDDAVKQGYILTRHFYNAVVAFEKDPAGIRGEYGGIIDAVDLRKEEKAAAEVQFASAAAPELVQLSRPEERRLLITAEKRLAAGDAKGAQELAQAALDKKIGDQGRALFILAEVAVANKNRDGAQDNFQKAILASNDPKVVAWSHLYLGRILDMKEDREAAVEQYRAALTAGATLPEIKAAAERGLAQAYEPPVKPQ
jgi:Domain of unknown function (DUF4932)